MVSRIAFFLMFAVAVFGGSVRLYLKDGTYQLANEYKVVKDRVSYLSSERGEWEEIPLELVDLARTKKEAAQHEEDLKADAKSQAEEDAALHHAVQQVEQIPSEPGVYYIRGGETLEPIKVAESKIVLNKRREVLKYMSPIPLVPGKSTLEIDGDSASKAISDKRPEFFFRLSNFENFGIVKLTSTKKGSRVVSNISVISITKQMIQQFQEIDTFKKQEGDNVYKIWPQKDMEPGEYALVEYTQEEDQSSINTQVWDFKIVSNK